MKKVTLNSLLRGVRHLCADGTTLCSSIGGYEVLWTLRNPHGTVTSTLGTTDWVEWRWRGSESCARRISVAPNARLDLMAVACALPVLAELANGSR